MLITRKFLRDAEESATRTVTTSVHALDSWNSLRVSAARGGSAAQLALVDTNIQQCEERLQAARLKLSEINMRIAALDLPKL